MHTGFEIYSTGLEQFSTYDNKKYKIYKIVEGVSVHDIVHDIYPSFQSNDLKKEAEKDRLSLDVLANDKSSFTCECTRQSKTSVSCKCHESLPGDLLR